MKTTKRIIAGVLSLTLVLGSLALPSAENGIKLFDTAITADAEVYGDFEYAILDDGTVEITGYTGQGGDVTIPIIINERNVTRIGYRAFGGCRNLTNVTIPNGVIRIEKSAFEACTSLTEISLSESVSYIGGMTFYACTSLTNIYVDENNSTFSSVNGVLFSKDKTKLIQYPVGRTDSSYSIPKGTKIIGSSAFIYGRNLTSVTIPDSVTSIYGCAFEKCTSLEKVSIPDSVTEIGLNSFAFCDKISSLKLSKSLTTISNGAFNGCSSLTSITIPDGVKSIEEYAFHGCSGLKSITIPKSVTEFGEYAMGFEWANGGRWAAMIPGFKIRCYYGSKGENYAKENNLDYEYVDSNIPTVRKVTENGFSCTSTAIRINWNKVDGASGYRVYRLNSSTKKWEKIATLSGGNTLTYRMSGLNPGTEYKYKVKAYKKFEGKTYWGLASDTIYTTTKPSAVTITKTSKSTTAVRLYWKEISCSGYEVQMYNATAKKWEFVGYADKDQTNYRINGLKKNKSYKFRVRAFSKISLQNVIPNKVSEWTYVTVRTRV